ncbi:MAG: CoA ester lyase [Pseudomonadota bacterium]
MSARARSWLFVPGDSERKIEKSATTDADVVVYDLEDAVVPERRAHAREQVGAILQRSVTPVQCVRVNPVDTKACADDVAAVMQHAPAWIMQPKLRGAACADQLAALLRDFDRKADDDPKATPIIAIVTETPEMALKLPALKSLNPRVRAVTWGAEDLSAALGAAATRDTNGDWLALYQQMRSQTLLLARSLDVLAIDTLFADFRDAAGLARYAAAAARDGFDGQLAIHPAQTDPINTAFTPSAEALEYAQRVIDAFAATPTSGAVQLDGRMLDRPHLTLARKLIARAS